MPATLNCFTVTAARVVREAQRVSPEIITGRTMDGTAGIEGSLCVRQVSTKRLSAHARLWK